MTLEKLTMALKRVHKWPRRKKAYVSISGFLVVLAIFSYLTNPFVRFSLVADVYEVSVDQQGKVNLKELNNVVYWNNVYARTAANFKQGWHIFSNTFSGSKKARSTKVDEIIKEIHGERFDPELPFLISGDHFSVFYTRSLGIFYHSILDPRTALDKHDWQNREKMYLKSLAYALATYKDAPFLSTTIVPVAPKSVVLMNFFAPPSDSMYSLLYGLDLALENSDQRKLYPYDDLDNVNVSLQTSDAARKLFEEYNQSLKRHFDDYWRRVYDPQTGLVKKDGRFSGTKDISIRYGAFYDNVIAWKTHALAQKLQLIPEDEDFLKKYKQRILKAFWDQRGFFVEDSSEEAKDKGWYSSDWLIAYQTGFLRPEDENDRRYLSKAIEYIQKNNIDEPFPIQYQPDVRSNRLYLHVRLFVPQYGSTAIWSHWGMEYIKLLTHLGLETNEKAYVDEATKFLNIYEFNIQRYRGYPEVYNKHGDFLQNAFYKSVRKTGWVVSYEQALEMNQWAQRSFIQKQSESN